MDPADDYDAIWRRDGATIWRAVYAYAGGRREVADDAVAEAFARAMARSNEVREPLAYLYRIAFRVASVELTRRTKEGDEMPEVATADPSTNGLPDVLRALKELTPAQRAAVYLHYRADMPVREIAYLTGMSSAAVKVHLMRGHDRLLDDLNDSRSLREAKGCPGERPSISTPLAWVSLPTYGGCCRGTFPIGCGRDLDRPVHARPTVARSPRSCGGRACRRRRRSAVRPRPGAPWSIAEPRPIPGRFVG